MTDARDGTPARSAPTGRRGTRWTGRLRATPGLRHAYRLVVFLLGMTFVALGIALVVLPGPLTIPPILLGVWIWSTEFRFAERLSDRIGERARDAWAQARRRPGYSAAITLAGLAAAATAAARAGIG